MEFSFDASRVPKPAFPDARARLDDFAATLKDNEHPLAGHLETPAIEALLLAIFGNSPYLSQCLNLEPEILDDIIRDGLEGTKNKLFAELQALPGAHNMAALASLLRKAKRRVALMTAIADLTQLWPVEEITEALSDFADLALNCAVIHLLHQQMVAGNLAWPAGHHDEAPSANLVAACGYFVLAMGKLGGRELNYSSDIDLIVFFDAEKAPYTGSKSVQDCFIRVTRDLVKLLQDRTQDGYVFRVDLRLRPDAGATAVAISTEAAEFYYQSMGLNWERAAMIKARVVAGDKDTGRAFLDILRPFIWRKNLDYAALDDIHAMKARIHAHHNHAGIAVAGHDIKLGHGGIREIEFFAQAHQLISGGRMPALRVQTTVGALRQIAQAGLAPAEDAEQLIKAYGFLRTLEHRIQMERDEQTHLIPDDPEGLDNLAIFAGYPDTEAFEKTVTTVLQTVSRIYDSLFADDDDTLEAHSLGDVIKASLAPDAAAGEAALEVIGELGFEQPRDVLSTLNGWLSGRYRATRNERARNLITALAPAILHAAAATATPDLTLRRLDDFISKLPAGVQLFSLFQSNASLLDLLCQIVGDSPTLAQFIGRSPTLFDAVLSPGFFEALPAQEALAQELDALLAQSRDFQDTLDLTRKWANERKFQLGVQTLRNLVPMPAGFRFQTDLAEAALRALYPKVEEEFARKYGHVKAGGMAIVAMGSFGGREMSFTSDLDLIFIYKTTDLDSHSDGAKALPVTQYYARLSQRFINAITAQTGEGKLYEVDMRLRPSGNAGPIALSLDSFAQYQREQAWTWEHMALTRARVVAGPNELREQIEAIIHDVLARPRDAGQLRHDVATMREKMDRELGSDNPWNVKRVRGGLLDVEFVSQYLQLLHGAERPEIIQPETATAIAMLGQYGYLSPQTADLLDTANLTFGSVRGFLRQCYGVDFNPEDITSPGILAGLAQAAGQPSFAALEKHLLSIEKQIRVTYDQIIGPPTAIDE